MGLSAVRWLYFWYAFGVWNTIDLPNEFNRGPTFGWWVLKIGRLNLVKSELCRQALTCAARQSRCLCATYYFQENIQFQENVLASSRFWFISTLTLGADFGQIINKMGGDAVVELLGKKLRMHTRNFDVWEFHVKEPFLVQTVTVPWLWPEVVKWPVIVWSTSSPPGSTSHHWLLLFSRSTRWADCSHDSCCGMWNRGE